MTACILAEAAINPPNPNPRKEDQDVEQSIKMGLFSPEIQSFNQFLTEVKEPLSCLEYSISEIEKLIPVNNTHLNVIRTETEVLKCRISLLNQFVNCFAIFGNNEEKGDLDNEHSDQRPV